MKKYTFKSLFTDWKHQIGWFISTFAISFVINLAGIDVFFRWYLVPIIYATIVLVDIIKHLAGLQ